MTIWRLGARNSEDETSGFSCVFSTAREYEPEVGLYYYRARFYDPLTGRFLQRDPVGPDGLGSLYAYVSNSPAVYVDPMGLQEEKEPSIDEIVQLYRELISMASDKGYHFAPANLRHFLEGHGKRKMISYEWLRKRRPVQRVEGKFRENLERQLTERSLALENGEAVKFAPEPPLWDNVIPTPWDTYWDPDLFYGSGSSALIAYGDFILTRNGNKITIIGSVSYRWDDDYNWNPGQGVEIPGEGWIRDDYGQRLVDAGRAYPFHMRSRWIQTLDAQYVIGGGSLWGDSAEFKWGDAIASPSSTKGRKLGEQKASTKGDK